VSSVPVMCEPGCRVGTVKSFNPTYGYGFIYPAAGGRTEVFFHVNNFHGEMAALRAGSRVQFETVGEPSGKPRAVQVRLL
jgi:cold shock CspA family protein